GQFPAATLDPDGKPVSGGNIDPDRLTQRFFPAGIDVDLAFVPEDELPALIEESLLLPPIDLTDSLEDRTGTGVIVLVPLSRAEFTRNRASLPNFDAQLPQLRPAFLRITAFALPRDLLLARRFAFLPVNAEAPVEELAWRGFLRNAL